MKNILAKILILAFLFSIFIPSALPLFAYTASGSLAIMLQKDKKPLAGVTISIKKVATAEKIGSEYEYTYTDDFKDCRMSLDDLTAENLVETVVYQGTDVNPLEKKHSDRSGKILFDKLDHGVYLIEQEYDVNEKKIKPFLFAIPTKNKVTGIWDFKVQAFPKVFTNNDNPPTPVESDIECQKVWKNAESHPSYVDVILLKDGKEFAKVTLNENNHWQYVWTNLEEAEWKIIEECPEGYEVSYKTDKKFTTITNTGKDRPVVPNLTPNTPTKPPDGNILPPKNPPAAPLIPSQPTSPITTLIQTGQYSLVIGLLFALGCICILIGRVLGAKYED